MNIPPEIPRVVPGQPIPRRALTRLAETVARTARTWVAGGLSIARVAGIPLWSNHAGRRIFVKLTGTVSPYSAYQVVPVPGGLWERLDGGLTLAGNCYPDNGERGLDGKVVEVFRTGGDWWHFPYPRQGIASSLHPPCPVTIHVAYYFLDGVNEGGPIAGAAVTVCGYPPVPGPECYSGTTDAAGNFTPPDLDPDRTYTVTVAHGGATYTGPVTSDDCPMAAFCYCEASISATVVGGGSDLTVTWSTGSGGSTGTVPLDGTTGKYTLKVNQIRPCGFPSDLVFPSPYIFTAHSDGWVDACHTFNYYCGSGDNTTTLTLYDFAGCFLSGARGLPPGTGPDFTDAHYRGMPCGLSYECQETANPDGLNPLGLQIRLAPVGGPCAYFGDDAGTWIDLPITENILEYGLDGSVRGRSITWSTGCRGGHGNFYSLPRGLPDCVDGPYTGIVYYGSSRISIAAECHYPIGINSVVFTYELFESGDCTINGEGIFDHYTFSSEGAVNLNVSHPVNNTYTLHGPINDYTVELREAPC